MGGGRGGMVKVGVVKKDLLLCVCVGGWAISFWLAEAMTTLVGT